MGIVNDSTDSTAADGVRRTGDRAAATAVRGSCGIARRHCLFLLLFLGGLALRVCAQLAYRPAILYFDSFRYLESAVELELTGGAIGYSLFIRPVLAFHNLAVLPAVNHLLGLGMAVAIYAVLLRRGAWRPLAALAAAPILLDGYQLQIEQMIMSDVLFQALLIAVFGMLAGFRRPGLLVSAVAGIAILAAISVRFIGAPLIVPVVLYLLLVGAGWRWRALTAVTCLSAFLAPLLVGFALFYQPGGGGTGARATVARIFYARLVPIANCAKLDLPAYQRPLCPDKPRDQRLNEDFYYWYGPVDHYDPPPGVTTGQAVGDFAVRVATRQPAAAAGAVGLDVLKYFAWDKRTYGNDLPISRWRFQEHYPVYRSVEANRAAVRAYGGHEPAVVTPLAEFLRGYQLSVGYTPGPVLFAAALAGVAAAAGVGRARGSGLRATCLTITIAGLGALLASSFWGFSWRYQLPALALLPLAGSLGITALFRRHPPT